MESKELFPLLQDPQIRNDILERILDIHCLNPSIDTFLEDTKWLEPPAEALRCLFSPGGQETLRTAMLECFQHSEHLQVEGGSKTLSLQSIFNAAYHNLFTFAWRHFSSLSSLKPRKDKNKSAPLRKAHKSLIESRF